VDEVIGVPDDEAIRAGRELAATEGLLAGIFGSGRICSPTVGTASGVQEQKNRCVVT